MAEFSDFVMMSFDDLRNSILASMQNFFEFERVLDHGEKLEPFGENDWNALNLFLEDLNCLLIQVVTVMKKELEVV